MVAGTLRWTRFSATPMTRYFQPELARNLRAIRSRGSWRPASARNLRRELRGRRARCGTSPRPRCRSGTATALPGHHRHLARYHRDANARRRRWRRWSRRTDSLLLRARAEEHWLGMILERTPTPLVFVEPGTARLFFANAAADRMAGGTLPRPGSAAEYPTLFDMRDDRPPAHFRRRDAAGTGRAGRRAERGSSSLVVPRVAARGAGRVFGAAGRRSTGTPETVMLAFDDISALKRDGGRAAGGGAGPPGFPVGGWDTSSRPRSPHCSSTRAAWKRC